MQKEWIMAASTRTTIAVPNDLLKEIDQAVQDGLVPNRNVFVVNALRRELAAQKRAAIDAAFAGMADDALYQTEAIAIAEEFAVADAEVFSLAETSR